MVQNKNDCEKKSYNLLQFLKKINTDNRCFVNRMAHYSGIIAMFVLIVILGCKAAEGWMQPDKECLNKTQARKG